ncbi:MAG: hypothetical protein AB1744_10525 [Candidatus Zixiibacteriota bacterium]
MDQKPKHYRLYLDESGDHTYSLLHDRSRRYLALLGIWFADDAYYQFVDGLEELKRDIFGPKPDNPVVFHRTDIMDRRGPFKALLDARTHRDFDRRLLSLISHPVKNYALRYFKRIPERDTSFGAQISEVVKPKLNRKYFTGKVRGYGLVYLPVSKK